MAAAPIVSATWWAAADMASAEVASGGRCSAAAMRRCEGSCSIRSITRPMISTAATGWAPAAVSADSITASAPS